MNRILLYIHALRHLRPGQVAALARYRAARRLRVVPPPWRGDCPPARGIRLATGLPSEHLFSPPGVFTFLETQVDLGSPPDWAASDLPRLWRYRLHSFDFLRQPGLTLPDGERLIASWIEAEGGGSADGWDPYPTATRLCNWTRWYAARAAEPPPLVRQSMARQAAWLERRLEWHLLGNHLLRNAAGLAHAGALLGGVEGDRSLAIGLSLFARQCREQVLPDGGHEERSPMYHAVVLQDLLDTLEIAEVTLSPHKTHKTIEAHREVLVEKARRMASFLDGFRHPDGEIPLFNDSAFGVAPGAVWLLDRASEVAAWKAPGNTKGGGLWSWQETGYYRLDGRASRLLFDAGPIGPDHQPGHAHADTFSFELSANGRRAIVDTGVSTYERGPVRCRERGTAAHSTLLVDGQDQSEVWASHRVGRRARPFGVTAHTDEAGAAIRGTHDGYRRLPGSPLHSRSVRRKGSDTWIVEDRIEGGGLHRVESRLQLAPGAHVEEQADGKGVRVSLPGVALRLTPSGGTRFEREEGWHSPRFGRRENRPVLVLHACGRLPLLLGYEIALEAPATDSRITR